MTQQHFTPFCRHLHKYTLCLLVVCRGRLEGGVVGTAWCELSACYVCAWGMSYVVGGCNVQWSCYTEHGGYGLSCLYAETVKCMSSAGSVWYVGFNYVMNMDMANMDRWKTVK